MISILTAANFEKKIFASDWGDANTCFHALFLTSICGSKVEMSIIYIGKANALKNSQPRRNIFFHGSVEKPFSASSPGLKAKMQKNMTGTNAAPRILNQKDDVRFIFKISACVDIIKLIG
jgi:hypothetical protein